MSKFVRIAATSVSVLALAVVSLAGVAPRQAAAHGTTATTTAETKKTTTTTPAKAADVSYEYVAQAGDSYTKFARKAVQTYGKKHKVNLSQGQIIFAETTLTKAASSPQLNLGEKRSFTESSLKTVVEQAGKLSATQVAAWNVYAKYVNFNTDKVGQKS